MNRLRRLLGLREKPSLQARIVLLLGAAGRTSRTAPEIAEKLRGGRDWGLPSVAGVVIALEELQVREYVEAQVDRTISDADLRGRGGRPRWLYRLTEKGLDEYNVRLRARWEEARVDSNSLE